MCNPKLRIKVYHVYCAQWEPSKKAGKGLERERDVCYPACLSRTALISVGYEEENCGAERIIHTPRGLRHQWQLNRTMCVVKYIQPLPTGWY